MQRGCSRQEFGMLQREMFLVESEDKMVSRKLLQSRARRMKPTPADFDVFRLLHKHAIRPANELQLRKGQFASTCPALIPVLINIFADREGTNSSQHSQFPIPSSSLARMGSRISQSEPLWWVDQGDILKNLAATALCIRQCPLFLPALPLRAQIVTCDYCTFAINTARLSPI